MPGIISGFLLAFTMSLDDFVITHFTKGPGVDTLSTKIYSEVRKGIKPEMYALSTIMFMTVLVLLFLINFTPEQKKSSPSAASKRRRHQSISHIIFKRVVPAAMILVIAAGGFLLRIQKRSDRRRQSADRIQLGRIFRSERDPDV